MLADETRHAMQVASQLSVLALPLQNTDRYQHFPNVFDSTQIQQLSLPTNDTQVALVDGFEFERFKNADNGTNLAYQSHRRTRVYESIDTRSDGWFSLVALQLSRLTRYAIVCTAYESHAGDAGLTPHHDEWFGVILQLAGTKQWTLWQDGQEQTIVTNPGDVLLLPRTVRHLVSTPEYSVHVVFAFLTDEPIAAHQ